MSEYKSNLQKLYDDKAVSALMKHFNYKSVMQVPRLEKICINMGVGEATSNSKIVDSAVADLTLIAGQKTRKPSTLTRGRATQSRTWPTASATI